MPPDERRGTPAGDEAGERRPIAAGVARPTAAPPLPLADGQLGERDAAELNALKQQIQETVGFYCVGYKERCLRRRIAVRMRARGLHTYSDYGALLASDPLEYDRLVDTLTINVSKFFRNPEVWDVIERIVVPALLDRPDEEIRIWSAGTAGGEEAYTLAIMLAEYERMHGVSTGRARILGTDIDRESLAQARRATYADFSMTDIDPEIRDRWFDHDGQWRLRDEARHRVRFETLDLIRDPLPQDQHLILCRNVIIYFERSVQESLFVRFRDALVPGGFLVLGKVETMFGAPTGLFRSVANRQRIFRRP